MSARLHRAAGRSIGSAVCLVFVVAFLGCAAGNVAPVTVPAGFKVQAQASGPLALGVRDRREDVVGGDDKETIVGHQRSLYGIPFAVQNSSGKPFAADLAGQIAKAFEGDAMVVHLSPFTSDEKVVDALVATGRDRLLWFDVLDWDADTYAETTLHYEIVLRVLDSRGRQLAESNVKGEDELKARGRPERQSVPAATADLIRTLLEPRAVVAAIEGRTPAEVERCTVDQILKMQESGLSQAQIEAACAGSD